MLVRMNDILLKARRDGYGVIAPSIFSLDLIKCAIVAAETKRSPLILNINLKYDFLKEDDDLEYFLFIARERARRATVPVAINLDHGQNYAAVLRAIQHGFTSVMIDASAEPYEENIRIVKEVVQTAHSIDVPVEAELGCVGMADPSFQIETKYTQSTTTDPVLVADFVERTGVDFLAVSIGNAHGPYAKNIQPHIEFELLREIASTTPIPLVLHGGSGTGDENLAKACRLGISKINVGTDLMQLAVEAAEAGYEENPNKGRLKFLTNYVDGYKKGIEYYMDIFGSAGKA